MEDAENEGEGKIESEGYYLRHSSASEGYVVTENVAYPEPFSHSRNEATVSNQNNEGNQQWSQKPRFLVGLHREQ